MNSDNVLKTVAEIGKLPPDAMQAMEDGVRGLSLEKDHWAMRIAYRCGFVDAHSRNAELMKEYYEAMTIARDRAAEDVWQSMIYRDGRPDWPLKKSVPTFNPAPEADKALDRTIHDAVTRTGEIDAS